MRFRRPNLGRLINMKEADRLPNASPRQMPDSAPDRLPCTEGGITDDKGNAPYVFDIKALSRENSAYRRVIWTGKHMQLALMCIPQEEDTGWELHRDGDQYVYVESGTAEISMGGSESNPAIKKAAGCGYAAVIPAGTLHKVRSIGREPLRLITVYAPPEHPYGRVDESRDDADRR